ncbi:sodium-dependent transporter [Brachyspira hyodysenteriae]|uniref:sodium-dependent transporter n=1 Tax=Brachyspira hyodysenteriae TaxID=159 RepID=UPI0022CD30B9|nr:sodium-dependent transporter [Brachyspira hyodysenteriae]MCZ9944310.1 sodium-dependent transporter [Brachyspira hyodysenteriae]MDA0002769.1 sodium-dependent transporter [Brachyspira hyodysenteriae]MDA0037497.1 sodium-dependent transporter [Brachyspira hyodysenteriae]MDA0074087.1 sodium-dependent transporter [Brachyspira hyodysenteriae]
MSHHHHRGQWGTRAGFILAAIGSAVGLGNIWRFPYMVASNGGGAFMIVFLLAMLTAGIPIMILEFSIGHKTHKSAPGALKALNPSWEWLGWLQVFTCFAIVIYYSVIIAWSLSYGLFSIQGLKWGTDTAGFFTKEYLKLQDGFSLSNFNIGVAIPLIIVWVIILVSVIGGVKDGIEKANKIFMPLLAILVVIILIRGVTLPGALAGLDYMFKPDFSKLTNPKIWIDAYGQVFYSMSVAFGIMITYSSYLPDDSDIANNAFMTGFADTSFSLFAGITVFSIIGYMAHTQGKPVAEVAGSGGIGLAFMVFPEAINSLPGLNRLFGVVFFLVLSFAGLTSAISLAEVVISSFIDKFHFNRKKVSIVIIIIQGAISMVYATGSGLSILDIVDAFINNYNIVVSGLIEIILVAWVYKLGSFKETINTVSEFTVGNWWDFCLKFLTPVFLAIMLSLKLINDFKTPYGGYPTWALFALGWSMPVIAFIAGILLAKFKDRQPDIPHQTK